MQSNIRQINRPRQIMFDTIRKERSKTFNLQIQGACSLRDEIGACPNIEIDIDMTDKTWFFIRPYHVKEENKNILDKEMKRLCYLGILKEGFLAYSSPVMLISRKVMQDKSSDRLQTFAHQNCQKQLSLFINKRYICNIG